MELRSVILEELQSNPALEELAYEDVSIEEQAEKPASSELEGEESAGDGPEPDARSDDLEFRDNFAILEQLGEEWNNYFHEEAGEQIYTSEDAQRRQHFFDSLTAESSFQETLMQQARMTEKDPDVLAALEFILGSLDDSGFLTAKPGDLALMSQRSLTQIQQALDLLRALDPPGIGAQDIQDCLLLQLVRKRMEKSLATRIVRDQWNLLLRRRIPEIARALNCKVPDVEDAIREIAVLDPAPARRFAEDTNRVVEPDVTVELDDEGEWIIILNNDYIPRLRISPEYKMLLAKGKLSPKEREYLQTKFRSGRFLMSAIEQRQQTIERITRKLLEFQSEFFDRGRAHLRPLTMNQVAESVGVHETTVSRAISGKFIRTPQGVFDMKFFFTPGYQSEDGASLSNKSIKDRIARVIESEPPQKPFSDQKLVEILKSEGITIARRTVAKYREELGILPTNLRRQYA